MLRQPFMRLVAALLAAAGGLSIPAAAVAHGVAHGREIRAHIVADHGVTDHGVTDHGVADHEAENSAEWHDAEVAPSSVGGADRGHEAPMAHVLADHDRAATVSAPHDTGDHGHPPLAPAVTTSSRTTVPLVAPLALPAEVPAVDVVLMASAALLLITAPARAGPAQVAPPPSRAPPIV